MNFGLWLFRLAMVADLAAIYFQWNEARYVSKPLIVLSLFFYFSQKAKSYSKTGFFKAALLLSLAGDIALMFEDRDPLFFMAGLGSFLLAHIAYIIAFMGIRRRYLVLNIANRPFRLVPRWPWIIFTLLYVSILLYVLLPYLGEFKIPVIVYAFVLGAMFLSVVHAFPNPYTRPGVICLAGGLLFIISDSTLAINKFYMGFPLAGLAIMLTYALAQYMLVVGAVRNYSSPNFGDYPA